MLRKPLNSCPLCAPKGRRFRQVLQDVQNGLDELGEKVDSSAYTFTSDDEVDMDLDPPEMYLSRLKYGCMADTDFTSRLADRLGLDFSKETNDLNEDLPE